MAVKIAFYNLKGGVGKTTTTINVADGLRQAGATVLVIDMDFQANATNKFISNSEIKSQKLPTIIDLLFGTKKAEECVIHTERGDIIAGTSQLELAEEKINESLKKPDSLQLLKEALKPLDQKYKFILIDVHPDFSTVTQNALYASNGIVVPININQDSINGLGLVTRKIEKVRKEGNPGLKIYGVLINAYDKGRTSERRFLENEKDQLQEASGIKIFGTVIRRSRYMGNASDTMTSVFDSDRTSREAKDYSSFIIELLSSLQ